MRYEITGTTRLTCLLGSPVAHSISPQMHNEAFRLLGLDYVYTAFDISPQNLPDAVHALKLLNVRGYNLTMPHKTAILPFMDELTPAAKLAQAVNTVTYESGRLIGHTTDGIGYMHSVKDAGYDILGKNMTLLGAGGAATAICTQAALDGVKNIYMFKRKNASWKTAQDFADKVTRTTDCQVFLYDIADTYQLKQALTVRLTAPCYILSWSFPILFITQEKQSFFRRQNLSDVQPVTGSICCSIRVQLPFIAGQAPICR